MINKLLSITNHLSSIDDCYTSIILQSKIDSLCCATVTDIAIYETPKIVGFIGNAERVS